MANAAGAKTTVDMALGAATTVAFAFGPVGAGVAAAIAVGKLLFDLFYQTAGLTDPMAQAPDKADLKNALDELRGQLDKDIFDDFTAQYQSDLFAAIAALNDAIRNAGQSPKTGACLPGPTPVWDAGATGPLWQPVRDNPGIFASTVQWLETSPQYCYHTASLYALTVGTHLLYLKTGLVWEVNNNLRDYERSNENYQSALDTWKTDMMTWQATGGDLASKPAPFTRVEPQPPTGGDPAIGSEVTDGRGNITGFNSRLGKASSWFAIATRDLLREKDDQGQPTGPIPVLEAVLNAHDADVAAKNKAIQDRLDLIAQASPSIHFWIDTKTGTSGSAITHKGFQTLQAALWMDGLAGNMDLALIKAKDLDKISTDDKTKLRSVVAKWRDTLKMYEDALTTQDDGPLHPTGS